MKRLDGTPIDPEIRAALDAIDATLAGEAVDPRHAELAELALLVAAERPALDPAFAASLDQRVKRRFESTAPPRRRRPWLWAPAAGLAAAATVAVVIAVGGGTAHRPIASDLAKVPQTSSASGASAGAFRTPAPTATTGSAVLQPVPNGRKVVQGAQLALSTTPGRVDSVAQEVFDVIGQQKGVVDSSSVSTGGTGGYARFQLSVPSSSLPQTMAALSGLRHARVASRSDTTQDVNDQYNAEVRRLADARALRTSLLKQLANATTQAQISSLTARIHDAEASISSDQASLRQLSRQVDLSQIALTITAGTAPVPASHGGGGFTLSRAAHDAGRVLTVAAGVVLIAAAALVPVVLVAALGWWIASLVRRRRREEALDTV